MRKSPVDVENQEVEQEETVDVAALKAELDRMKQHHEKLLGETKAAKQKAKEEAEERERLAADAAAKNGDVEALRKSYETKLAQREQELTEQLGARDKWLDEMTVSRAATELAAELDFNGSGKLLMPLITPRLKRDTVDGRPVVTVLDKDGRPSAMTLADLKKEFMSDASLASFVKGSSATGGGAQGSKSSNGGGAAKGNMGGTKQERQAAIAQRFNLNE
jgi:hypothetical protein